MERVPVKGKRSNPSGKGRSVPDFYQEHNSNQAVRHATMVQSLSSLSSNIQLPSNPTAPVNSFIASLQASEVARMMTHPRASEVTAFNNLASRYPYHQAGIPWTTIPEHTPTLLSLYNPTIAIAENQDGPIEAYLRELMLLSSIRQNHSRR